MRKAMVTVTCNEVIEYNMYIYSYKRCRFQTFHSSENAFITQTIDFSVKLYKIAKLFKRTLNRMSNWSC